MRAYGSGAGAKGRPQGYWDAYDHRRAFFDSVAAAHGVTDAVGWRKVRYEDIAKMGGRGLLGRYGSTLEALQEVYPELEFSEECRQQRPKRFFEEAANRRSFMERIKAELGVEKAEDWKHVKYSTLEKMGAKRLLARYSSMQEMLLDVFPEEKKLASWALWKRVPKRYFDSRDNCKNFLQRVAKECGVRRWPEDWKKVTYEDVTKLGGRMLLMRYESLFAALRDLFPRHDWDVFSCRRHVPSGFWSSKANVCAFVKKLAKELRVTEKEQWYRVSAAQVCSIPGGSGLLQRMRLFEALCLAYPNEEWDDLRFSNRSKKSMQWQLWTSVRLLYPGMEVVEEHMLDTGATPGMSSNGAMELDVFVPHLNLAFEYQGIHHYTEVPLFGPLDLYIRRDERKRLACEQLGIKLIEVPFWWDNRPESLASTIIERDASLLRQDVVEGCQCQDDRERLAAILEKATAHPCPIPRVPPSGVLPVSAGDSVIRWGSNVWTEQVDPKGMLLRANREGIRVFWNGEHLGSQQGRKIKTPTWWSEKLPRDKELEGELWMEGGNFRDLVARTSLARNWGGEQDEENWKGIKFVAQDIPDASRSFVERVAELKKLDENDVLVVETYTTCEGKESLKKLLQEDTEKGGEGLLLMDPEGVYRYGRAFRKRDYLRVKQVQEATVVFAGKASRPRWLIVEHCATKLKQMIRCSSLAFSRPPPLGQEVTIAHLGQWPNSGRFKYPFLVE